jgi:glycosyltransferase involved in cell wall biosynthesis
MRVLIDGLNFELQHGTGIKTYTRSLIAALHANGNDIDILSEQNIPKLKYVFPVDVYLSAKLDFRQQSFARKNIRDRLIQNLIPFTRSFRGDINLRTTNENQVLSHYFCREWSHINKLRISPSLFARSFVRAGLNLGLSNISSCEDNDILFLSSPIPVRLRGRINILTVHDCIPLSHPWLLERGPTVASIIGRTLDYTIKTADKIICISESTKIELLKRFNLEEKKLHVVYQPCRYSLAPEVDSEDNDQLFLEQFRLGDAPYILFIGAIEPKKNLYNLLKTVQQNKNLPKLVIVGQFAWSSSRERDLIANLSGRVQHLGYLTDKEVEMILKNASAFVFPSFVEGFGLPPLEAMWKEVPCVLSNIPVFKELFHDHAEFVDPYDLVSIYKGILRALARSSSERAAAKTYVQKTFSLTNFRKKLENVIAA